jgi:MYXO-CTERM domain-containing protein
MRPCRFLVPVLLACSALPLRATIITLEEFTAASMPAGWSTSIDTGYGISFPGGDAVFSRSPGAADGFARLTFNSTVSGDFFAVAVVPGGDYSLVNGGSIALAALWSGTSDFFDAYIRNDGGNIQQAAFNSLTLDNPWSTWASDAVLILLRTGNNIQAGIMSGIPLTGGVADFSTFSPLGNWTGNQYLGDVTLFLSFGVSGGASGASAAGVDIFALAVPPYTEFIPPGGAEIPEPVTAGLAAAGLLVLLLMRRRRCA